MLKSMCFTEKAHVLKEFGDTERNMEKQERNDAGYLWQERKNKNIPMKVFHP